MRLLTFKAGNPNFATVMAPMMRNAIVMRMKLVLAAVEPFNSMSFTSGPTKPHNVPAARICSMAIVSWLAGLPMQVRSFPLRVERFSVLKRDCPSWQFALFG